ncbi:MAG: amidohydrolase family protein, partial [Actinobacteria bacterium]|nr:amidohydrolase family protein [Actinomycetota bacterium]
SGADLTTAAGGRPVFLPNRDHHSAWVSPAALARAGITRDTPDPPDGRIGGVAGDARTGQRGRADPGAVVVPVGQEHRAAPGHVHQVGGDRDPAREGFHGPAAAQDPVARAQAQGAHGVRDDPQVLVPGPQAGEVAAQALQAAADRVDVGVAERGDDQAAAEVDDPGPRAGQRPGLGRAGQGGDPGPVSHERVAATPGPVR